MKKEIIFIIFYNLFITGFAQIESIEAKFDSIAKNNKNLNKQIRIDVNGLSINELITSIAEKSQINVSVDPNLGNEIVESNFFDVKVKDVFSFLVYKFNLDVKIIKNILYFKKKKLPKKKIEKKTIKIKYNKEKDLLTLNLKNDSLLLVAEKITNLSSRNIILSPKAKGAIVSVYIKEKPFLQTLLMLAKSNNLVVNKDTNDFYYFDIVKAKQIKKIKNRNNKIDNKKEKIKDFSISIEEDSLISIKGFKVDISKLIKIAAEKTKKNYFFYNEPSGITKSLLINRISFEELLNHLFIGENYTYRKKNNLFIIGKNDEEGIRKTDLIQLENRTIESVLQAIPSVLKNGLEISEFSELNGLIVTGTESKINELKNFIFKIDKIVPLVQIEVLIVQFKKGYDIQTGITAGLNKDNNVNTGGILFPSTNVNINAASTNSLIDAFNGFGVINLGRVTKNFYLNLKSLENNSVIDLKSTPKIATLSGHKADISIGETSYYFEQTNRLISSGVNQDILQSGQWKSTNANLSVSIVPFVSKDEYVTLEISVEKSSFLARVGENAPPGKVSQKFNALVRVKNNEMILLGGLDEAERENSGSGTPFISRIPIIKWFFSSRKKKKSKSKLHIFIKPKIIY